MIKKIATITALGMLVFAVTANLATADSFWGRNRGERGSGNLLTEVRDLETFDRIRLESSADLVITVGPKQKVEVTADDNLLDNIVTEVVGSGTLVVTSDGSYSSRRGIRVEITVPALKRLDIRGSGDVIMIGLKEEQFNLRLDGSGDVDLEGAVDNLELTLNGSGDVTVREIVADHVFLRSRGSGDVDIRGKAELIDISVRGSGDVDARRLHAREAEIAVSGSGNVYVYASEFADGICTGSGDIDVFGDPTHLSRKSPGSGDIRRR